MTSRCLSVLLLLPVAAAIAIGAGAGIAGYAIATHHARPATVAATTVTTTTPPEPSTASRPTVTNTEPHPAQRPTPATHTHTEPVPRRTITPTPTPAAAPLLPVIYGCDSQPVRDPATYVLTCADADTRLFDIIWQHWGTQNANGTGQLLQNDCDPDCADGIMVPTPVAITLSWPESTNGESHFTRLDLSGTTIHQTYTLSTYIGTP